MTDPASGGTQPQDEIHSLIHSAVAQRRPIVAMYKERKRLLCPHRLGWNSDDLSRVLCYQYGGESESGLGPPGDPGNWRCLALERLGKVELLEGPWHTAENHTRPAHCIVRVEIDVDDQPDREPQNGQ